MTRGSPHGLVLKETPGQRPRPPFTRPTTAPPQRHSQLHLPFVNGIPRGAKTELLDKSDSTESRSTCASSSVPSWPASRTWRTDRRTGTPGGHFSSCPARREPAAGTSTTRAASYAAGPWHRTRPGSCWRCPESLPATRVIPIPDTRQAPPFWRGLPDNGARRGARPLLRRSTPAVRSGRTGYVGTAPPISRVSARCRRSPSSGRAGSRPRRRRAGRRRRQGARTRGIP